MSKKQASDKYVAFLRGINVGGHRLTMERLSGFFTELKLANVWTFIASGNVVFEAPAANRSELEKRIESYLRTKLGYDVDTFVRTPAELATIVDQRPFASADLDNSGHTMHVIFLRESLNVQCKQILSTFRTEVDELNVIGSEMFWLCRTRSHETQISWPKLMKALGTSSTARNIKALRRLVAKLS